LTAEAPRPTLSFARRGRCGTPPPTPSLARRGLNGRGTSPNPLLRKEGAFHVRGDCGRLSKCGKLSRGGALISFSGELCALASRPFAAGLHESIWFRRGRQGLCRVRQNMCVCSRGIYSPEPVCLPRKKGLQHGSGGRLSSRPRFRRYCPASSAPEPISCWATAPLRDRRLNAFRAPM